MFGSASPSLADIAAVTGNNNRNNGFGDGEGWWIILLWALFGGYGYGGFGQNGRSNETQSEIQRGFDTSTIISKLDGINNGICSLGYDQLAQMNTINTNVMQTGFGIQQAITNAEIANMQNTNMISSKIDNCCCENRQGQADLKYTMATDTCAITTAIKDAAQNIIQNDNANYRQLHDEQVALQMQQYKERLAEKDVLINNLNMRISQDGQSDSIVDRVVQRLSTCPVGTYNVPNPNCCYGPWGANNWTGFIPQSCNY